MKKGQIYEGKVESVRFPDRGIVSSGRLTAGDEEHAGVPGEAQDAQEEAIRVTVKNTLPGQRVRFVVRRCKNGAAEGRLLEVVEKSPLELREPACPHYGECGGCNYQTLPYEEQLRLKAGQVLDLLREVVPGAEDLFEGIRPSPLQFGYRNKMEFTFGDAQKGGPLTLGMHRRGSSYDIVSVEQCRIVDEDYRKILSATQDFFREAGTPYYHRMRHEGYLRHLLVRKAVQTGEILIDLVTTTQKGPSASVTAEESADKPPVPGHDACGEEALLNAWRDRMLSLPLDGSIAGILHTRNDSLGDVVLDGGTDILYGRDFFYEEILGLKFRITPFSFFQTNSLGAEVLYETAREMIADATGTGERTRLIYDLYTGTGTIAQMLASAADRVIGVEIAAEAVEAARENAKANGLGNCRFIAGDVLDVLDELNEKPDFIVLDPPREGVHPKALKKIIDYGAPAMLYISCKPTSLQRDLRVLQESGYRVERLCCVDLFPGTVHVETAVLLTRSEEK